MRSWIAVADIQIEEQSRGVGLVNPGVVIWGW